MLLTPWSWVLLEKLTGSQLLKKFPILNETRRFITAFTSAHHLPLSYVTDQISPKSFQLHRLSSLISLRPSVRHFPSSSSFSYNSTLASSTAEVAYNLIRTTNVNLELRYFFYVLLTVHLSITLVNDQLDAQFLYFIIRLLQSSTCFEQRRAHHQEVKLY